MYLNKVCCGLYFGVIVYKLVHCNLQCINYRSPTPIPTSDTAIFETVASVLYLSADVPYSEKSPSAPPIILVTATCHIQKYTATCRTLTTHLPDPLHNCHIFPNFNNSLVGIGTFCDADCKVLFTKDMVAVFDPAVDTIIIGWQEIHQAQLC